MSRQERRMAMYQMRSARRREFAGYLSGFAGSTIGKGVIPRILGQGDYNIVSNSIINGGGDSSVAPQFESSNSFRSIRVAKREYITDVQSSINFTNTVYQINPANVALFPWLSSIAQNFQEYRIHGMVLQYTSLSSDALNSTNTALGAVIMSTDYNAANAPYSSKASAENAEYTVSTKPSQSLIHGIECDPMQTVNQGHLYISPLNNGRAPAGEDIKTYNLGTFQFMTQGSQAVATIGELWVSYDIELIKPVEGAQLNRSAADHYSCFDCGNSGAGGFLFGTTRNADSLGVGTTITSGNLANNKIEFPASAITGQKYLILYQVNGSAVTIARPTFVNTAVDFLQVWETSGTPDTTLVTGPQNGLAATTSFMMGFIVQINNTVSLSNRASIVFDMTAKTLPTGDGDLMIIQLPQTFA